MEKPHVCRSSLITAVYPLYPSHTPTHISLNAQTFWRDQPCFIRWPLAAELCSPSKLSPQLRRPSESESPLLEGSF